MTSNVALQHEESMIVACTVARDVQNFDLLIEDMEAELGEGWGDLDFEDADAFLKQPDAASLQFIAVAVDGDDEHNLTKIGALITAAREKEIKVILIAEDVSPSALHQLLRFGANDFVPYPLPEGALHEAITRSKNSAPMMPDGIGGVDGGAAKSGGGRGTNEGAIIAVHGLAGGAGATTFAINLAWELATSDKKHTPSVCVLDLDFQFGSVATYLDLPRREIVYEVLSDIDGMDDDSFIASLQTVDDKVHVLTAPADLLPLDIIQPEEVQKLIETAQRNFDFVIIDMPTTLVQWSETVLSIAQIYFTMVELDLRSAQNALRLVRALKAEDLPHEKLRFVLNKAPKFTDMSGKSRAKRMAESLEISMDLHLPDGGKPVAQSCDHGVPLSEANSKNVLRKEILKLAKSLLEVSKAETAAAN
ncbi:MAG: AAA family ATPase [Litoreibacter sp.]